MYYTGVAPGLSLTGGQLYIEDKHPFLYTHYMYMCVYNTDFQFIPLEEIHINCYPILYNNFYNIYDFNRNFKQDYKTLFRIVDMSVFENLSTTSSKVKVSR